MTLYNGADDNRLTVQVRDISGGLNSRQHASGIKPNQVAILYNVDLAVPGQASKRPGIVLLEDLGDADAGIGCLGFNPIESTNANELLVWHGQKLEGSSVVAGVLDTFVHHKTDITTTGEQTNAFQAFRSGSGSCVLFKNTTDDWMQYDPNDTPVVTVLTDSGNTNPPKEATIGCFFRGRAWLVGNNYAWFSDAYPSTYATTFSQSANAYNIPIGKERAAIPVRDTGIIFLGQEAIYGLNPSMTPAATDKPEKLLDIGCVAAKTAQNVGDDVFFLAPDGVRGVFRTVQDKLQLTQSFPLSFVLKDQFEDINWAQIEKATAIWWSNMYMIALPTGSSTHNDVVWVYYPANQSWSVITGWSVGDWDIVNVAGEERLYYIAADEDKVYRAWTGYSDAGTAINYQEEGRKEDMGQPLTKKVGGEVEVKANNAGNYNLSVWASVDEQDYASLGNLNLSSVGPVVGTGVVGTAVLVGESIVKDKFSIWGLGEWSTIQIKLQHNATNGSDTITVYERNIVTYPSEYYSE